MSLCSMKGVVHAFVTVSCELTLLSTCGRWYTESTKAVNPISSNTSPGFEIPRHTRGLHRHVLVYTHTHRIMVYIVSLENTAF